MRPALILNRDAPLGGAPAYPVWVVIVDAIVPTQVEENLLGVEKRIPVTGSRW